MYQVSNFEISVKRAAIVAFVVVELGHTDMLAPDGPQVLTIPWQPPCEAPSVCADRESHVCKIGALDVIAVIGIPQRTAAIISTTAIVHAAAAREFACGHVLGPNLRLH